MKAFIKCLFVLLLASGLCTFRPYAIQGFSAPVSCDTYYIVDPDGNHLEIQFDVNVSEGTASFAVMQTNSKINFLVQNQNKSYTYRAAPAVMTTVPLNMGSGDYTFAVRLYVTNQLVEEIWSRDVSVNLEDDLAPYLSASQIINWTPEMSMVATARKLADGKDQKAVALAFCDYIAKEFKPYDPSPISPNYIPNLQKITKEKRGICYDFAALYTAMCRSVGIPCKLYMGYSKYIDANTYHAWCGVYLDGKWYVVDPSYNIVNGTAFLDPAYTSVKRVY